MKNLLTRSNKTEHFFDLNFKKNEINPVTHLQIEPTTRCNFTCGFCSGRSMEQGNIEFDLFRSTVDLLPDVKFIELQGEGEPLMHARFFEMAEYAKAKGIKLAYVTNGSLLNSANVENILKIGFEHIAISLESQDKDKFKEIRGGNFSKVVNGIEYLVTERNRKGLSKPAIGFSVTVLKDTKKELLDIAALYERLRLDGGIFVQPLQKVSAYFDTYEDDMKEQVLTQKEEIEVLALTHPMFKFFNHREYKDIEDKRSNIQSYYDDLFTTFKLSKRACPFLERSLFVNFQGLVTPCCQIKNTKKYSLGSMNAESIADILDQRHKMQQEFRQGLIPQACRGCKIAQPKNRLVFKSLVVFSGILFKKIKNLQKVVLK